MMLIGGSYGLYLGLYIMWCFLDRVDWVIFYGVEGLDYIWDNLIGFWCILEWIVNVVEVFVYYVGKVLVGGLL